ncbi:MAG: hypothetical protein E7085_02960 [Parabacteroides distasonis]|nr:hypothetical protein [Parabacteroides distasonis]MBQ4163226.1 hypothetical protein [Parabacteroides sp.]
MKKCPFYLLFLLSFIFVSCKNPILQETYASNLQFDNEATIYRSNAKIVIANLREYGLCITITDDAKNNYSMFLEKISKKTLKDCITIYAFCGVIDNSHEEYNVNVTLEDYNSLVSDDKLTIEFEKNKSITYTLNFNEKFQEYIKNNITD